MLADEPGVAPEVLDRGLAWLCGQQEADGSWFGRWGVNYVYGTGAAVPALIRAGVAPDDPRIRRAVTWLEDHQNPDGGWGEDLRSYIDESWRGRGASTASQTAWALLALLAAGEAHGPVTRRGMDWLRQPSKRTAAGTSPGSPGPASRGTSASTTTSTVWSCRSWPWAATARSLEAADHDQRRGRNRRQRAGPAGAGPAAGGGPGRDRRRSGQPGSSGPAPGLRRAAATAQAVHGRRSARRRGRGGRGRGPGRRAGAGRPRRRRPGPRRARRPVPAPLASAPLVAAALRRRGLDVTRRADRCPRPRW